MWNKVQIYDKPMSFYIKSEFHWKVFKIRFLKPLIQINRFGFLKILVELFPMSEEKIG